jgi:hypothetical protein
MHSRSRSAPSKIEITFRLIIESRPLVSAAMPEANNARLRATYMCLLISGLFGVACAEGETTAEPLAPESTPDSRGSGGSASSNTAGTAGYGIGGTFGGTSFDAGSGSGGSGPEGGAGTGAMGTMGITGAAGTAGTTGSVDAGSTGSAGATGNTAATNAKNQKSPLGTNLGPLTDYSSEWAFVDAMKASRAWISGSGSAFDDGRAVQVDENGWVRSLLPGQVARTLMFWDIQSYPTGQYVVLYDGKGTLEYFGGATKNAAASKPGRDVIDVRAGGIGINLTAIDAAAPLRNIRVIMPGGACSNDGRRYCDASAACGTGATCESFEKTYATQIFHPKFLERLAPYKVLRFMDWSATNNSQQKSWADRPLPTDARWTVNGAPIEIMVELVSRLGADPWFTVYHQADDAYVKQFAALVKQKLNASSKVYVEHSNEVWNGMFDQSKYVQEKGTALGLSSDPYEAGLRYHAKRSVEIFGLFSQQFEPARLVRVMGSQAASAWASATELDYPAAKGHTDAVAIAPYFGGDYGSPEHVGRVRGMSADQLLSDIESTALPQAIGWMKEQAAVAKARGVSLIAYEGGQHLSGIFGAENDAALNTLFDSVNRHPRMKSLYTRYLDAWKQNSGKLFVHYVNCGAYSKWGRWGALESLDQPREKSPKYDALMTFIENNPVWW